MTDIKRLTELAGITTETESHGFIAGERVRHLEQNRIGVVRGYEGGETAVEFDDEPGETYYVDNASLEMVEMDEPSDTEMMGATELPEPIEGLEGPWRMKNGRVVYYDPREGQYYDRSTDMYLSQEEADELHFGHMGEEYNSFKETKMPSGVIKHKTKLEALSDQELKEYMDRVMAEKGLNQDQLVKLMQKMAWRHGYGEMSSYYVDRYNAAGQSVEEEGLPGYDEWKTRSPYENEPSERDLNSALEYASDAMDRYLDKEGAAYIADLTGGQLHPEDVSGLISDLTGDLIGIGQQAVEYDNPGIDLENELRQIAGEKLESRGIQEEQSINLENAGFMDVDEALRIKRIQDLAGIKDVHPWSEPVEEAGVGILTPQNTTADVKKGTLKNQGQKFGFDISDDGMPPRISKDSGIKKN